MKLGAIIFDDPKVAREGWASDGENTTRINGHGDLSSDTLWISNLQYPQWRKLSFDNTQNILHAQYMRSTIDQISKETGCYGDPEASVTEAARVYNQVNAIGEKHLKVKISSPGYRYSNLVADAVMPKHMKATPDITYRQRLMEAFKESTQENQSMSARSVPQGSSVISYAFPRASYSKWLLEQPVPVGNKWKEIKKQSTPTKIGTREGELVKGTKGVIKKLLELGENHAVFMRVAVTYTDKFYRTFSNFGNGSNHMRGWATLPEILTMSKYSVIELHGGFMTELGYLDTIESLTSVPYEFSYSKGLAMENLWVSLATPRYKDNFTAVGAYIRAYDRAMCWKAASRFASEGGYIIGSYGAGRVQVYLRDGEIPEANEFAADLKMIAPLYTSFRGEI